MQKKVILYGLLAVGMTAASYGQDERKQAGLRATNGGIDASSELIMTSRPDSVLTTINGVQARKDVYSYEDLAQGTKITQNTYEWSSDFTSLYRYQNETWFDVRGKIIQVINYNWNNTANDFVVYGKEYYEYDEHGNMTLHLDTIYNTTTNMWSSYYNVKHENEYDAQGNLTSTIHYQWFYYDSEWIKYWKEEYTCDASGNLIVSQQYNWNDNTWKITVPKYEYAYDEQGRKISEIEYNSVTISYEDASFTAGYKYEWEYDSSGNITGYSEYKRSGSDWPLNRNNAYEYDAHGNRIKDTYSHVISVSISQWYVGSVLVTFNPPRVYTRYDTDYIENRTYNAQNRLKNIEKTNYIYKGALDAADGIELEKTILNSTTYYYTGESNKVESVAAENDAIVSIQYYDLQGRVVTQPQRGHIYMVKEIRQSGKASVRKEVR
jgi:hypothetical protein